MARFLAYNDGSRFNSSHGFTNLLLTQMEDCLEGKQVPFVLRKNKDKDGSLCTWVDLCANDYIFRSDFLKNMCFYELKMLYEKKFMTFDQMKKHNSGTGNKKEDGKKVIFRKDHPGHHYS